MPQQHLVYTLAFLSSPPHVTPSSLLPHLDHIDRWLTRLPHTSYSVITAAYASSPAIRAIFIRGFQIPLAMKQPVRHVVHHSVAKSWEGLRRWVSGVRGAVEMWQRWNDQTGWEDLRVSSLCDHRSTVFVDADIICLVNDRITRLILVDPKWILILVHYTLQLFLPLLSSSLGPLLLSFSPSTISSPPPQSLHPI